jgi:hypothetical protein
LGGCGTVGESLLNIINGSRHRLSAIVSALTILVVILWAAPAVNLIPMTTLTAVVFAITFHTFYWPTFVIWLYIRKSDTIIIIAVTLLSIFTNLGIGTLVGIAIASITMVIDSYNAFVVSFVDVSVAVPGHIVDKHKMSLIDPKNQVGRDDDDDDQNGQQQQPTTLSPTPSLNIDRPTLRADTNTNLLTPDQRETSTQPMAIDDLKFDALNGDDDNGQNHQINPISSPGSPLHSPTINENARLNEYPMSSPYQPDLAQNDGQNNNQSDKNGQHLQELQESPQAGSIYALDNYKILDYYICYHYVPEPVHIHNPHAIQSPKESNQSQKGPNQSTQSQDRQNGQGSPEIDNGINDIAPGVTTTTDNIDNAESVIEKNENNPNPDPSSPSDLIIINPTDIINQAAFIIPNVRLYRLSGIVFFGSVRAITLNIIPALDPEFTIIDCNDVVLTDYSASTALAGILQQYSELGKRCKLIHVNSNQGTKTMLRDRNLTKLLSRLDETTYIVLTKDELRLRGELKEVGRKEKKKKEKEEKQKKGK